jgi:hypothetical protein
MMAQPKYAPGPCSVIRNDRRSLRVSAAERRGVLILVVLSLLILFVVIAVMFVIVATRARAIARAYSDVGRTGNAPREVVDNIALDVIRGAMNPHSPFRTTSLLEDITASGAWSMAERPSRDPSAGSSSRRRPR